MPKRVGIRKGENYQIAALAKEGYSPAEVGEILGVHTDVVENFWPTKKRAPAKKAAPKNEVADDG